jgi:hypothetical protein
MKKLIITIFMLTLSTTAVASPDKFTKMICNATTKISYDIVNYKNKGLSKGDTLGVLIRLGGDDSGNSPRAKEIEYIYANDITDASLHREAQYAKCVAELTK